MEYDGFRRRAVDRGQQEEIEDLIAQEQDPKIRLQLMVMNRINLSLVENTNTIQEINSKLETHLTNFAEHTKTNEALVNKGRGAWRVVIYVFSFLQIAAISTTAYIVRQQENYRNEILEVKTEQIRRSVYIDAFKKHLEDFE